MWIEEGTVWHSECGLEIKQCGTVYVDRTGNRVVQCIWTELGTV